MANPIPFDLQHMAAFFGCSVDAVREQYAANAADCEKLAKKAKAHKSGKANGKTEDYWTERAATYAAYASQK